MKIRLMVLITAMASAITVNAETVRTIQGIGTYTLEKSRCDIVSGENICSYTLKIKSVAWLQFAKMNKDKLTVTCTYKLRNFGLSTTTREITKENWDNGSIDKILFSGESVGDKEPNFTLKENANEIAKNEPEAIQGFDWSKAKKDTTQNDIKDQIVGEWCYNYNVTQFKNCIYCLHIDISNPENAGVRVNCKMIILDTNRFYDEQNIEGNFPSSCREQGIIIVDNRGNIIAKYDPTENGPAYEKKITFNHRTNQLEVRTWTNEIMKYNKCK